MCRLASSCIRREAQKISYTISAGVKSLMNINNAVDKAWESKSLKEIADAPVEALQGVSDNDAKLLKEAFNVDTVRKLAELKYVKWAQAIVALADTEQ